MRFEKNLLFGFHETALNVSSEDISQELRCRSKLHFSITLAEHSAFFQFDEDSAPEIKLSVTIGSGAFSMFTNMDSGGYGTIACPIGFKTQGWKLPPLSNNKLECTITSTGTQEPVSTLLFVWSDIISTAPEGYANMTITLSGFPGMDNTRLSCTIFKKLADVGIKSFIAKPSTTAPGGKVSLQWTVENASDGFVTPGGYRVLDHSTSCIDIVFGDKKRAYFMNLIDAKRGVFERAFVYTAPPHIEDMKLENGILSWEVHFARSVELVVDGISEVVQPCSSKSLPEGACLVNLRCYGERLVERLLQIRPVSGGPVAEVDEFYLQVEHFEKHIAAIIFWDTAGLSDIVIMVTDTKSIVVSKDEPKGSWENIYQPGTKLQYYLKYKINGVAGSYLLRYV